MRNFLGAQEEHLAKILKIDFRYFFHGGLWLILGQGISVIVSLLLSVIFANKLNPEVYGQYRYLSSIIGIISAFTLTGLGTALAQAVAKKKYGSVLSAFNHQFRWSLLVSFVGFCLAATALFRNNLEYAWAFSLFLVTFPVSNACILYDDFLRGKSDFAWSTKYYLVYSIIINLFLGSTAFFFSTYFLLLFPLVFVIQACLNFVIYQKVKAGINVHPSDDPGLVSYAKHLSLTNILATIADQIDGAILFLVAGPQVLAVYSFAIAGPEFIKNFFKQVVPLSIPKLAVMDWTEVRAVISRHLIKLFIVSLLIVFVYLVSCRFLFQLFFPKYISAVPFSQVFALSLSFFPVYLLISALQAQKRVRELYLFNLLAPVISIVLLVLFTIKFGLWGVVVARVIARSAVFIVAALPFFQKPVSS